MHSLLQLEGMKVVHGRQSLLRICNSAIVGLALLSELQFPIRDKIIPVVYEPGFNPVTV